MSITELGLLMREEPLRHDEVQLGLRSGHCHVQKPTPDISIAEAEEGVVCRAAPYDFGEVRVATLALLIFAALSR
jgi:hypothetical protein